MKLGINFHIIIIEVSTINRWIHTVWHTIEKKLFDQGKKLFFPIIVLELQFLSQLLLTNPNIKSTCSSYQ